MRFLLYFLVFIAFADLFVQLPITSTYAQDLHATAAMIGFIVGAYSLTNLFSNVFGGALIDSKGPRPVLLIGLTLNGIILFLYAFATTPVELLAVRFLNGVAAGVITPASFTYITLFSNSKKKGKAMAFAGAAVGLAAVAGPAFSGIIASVKSHEAVYISLASLMLIGALITLTLKPVQKGTEKKVKTEAKKGVIADFLPLFKNKGLLLAFAGATFLSASQGILAYMLPLKVRMLGMETHISGMLMSVFGIFAILFFLLPTNRIFDKYRNEAILPIGLIIISLSQTMSSLVESLPLFIISMAIYGIGFAFIFPSMSALIAAYSTESTRGKAFGLFYGFFSLGSFLGSSITGALNFTPNQGFLSIASILIVAGTALLLANRKIALS